MKESLQLHCLPHLLRPPSPLHPVWPNMSPVTRLQLLSRNFARKVTNNMILKTTFSSSCEIFKVWAVWHQHNQPLLHQPLPTLQTLDFLWPGVPTWGLFLSTLQRAWTIFSESGQEAPHHEVVQIPEVYVLKFDFLVAIIKHRWWYSGADSGSAPCTPTPTPFSPSPAQVGSRSLNVMSIWSKQFLTNLSVGPTAFRLWFFLSAFPKLYFSKLKFFRTVFFQTFSLFLDAACFLWCFEMLQNS